MKTELNLTRRQSDKRFRDLIKSMQNNYGIKINMIQTLQNGIGGTHDGMFGDLSIDVGYHPRLTNGVFKKVYDIDFLTVVCALYHEEQHVIQACDKYQNISADEDTIQMAIRKIATETNVKYYYGANRYDNDLSEIDAELHGVVSTYNYVRAEFPDVNADKLICELVNNKSKIGYFVHGEYSSIDEIIDAFSNAYEDAKHATINGYTAYELRKHQDLNNKDDECIRYLQACVRENEDNKDLMAQFNNTSLQSERDLLLASVTCHLHPEINYEKLYLCLTYTELSPENTWDRKLPDAPDSLKILQIDEAGMHTRIEIAKRVHENIERLKFIDHTFTHEEYIQSDNIITHEITKTNEPEL